jgi:hypothetical protein
VTNTFLPASLRTIEVARVPRARALPRGRGLVYHMADYALSTEW